MYVLGIDWQKTRIMALNVPHMAMQCWWYTIASEAEPEHSPHIPLIHFAGPC